MKKRIQPIKKGIIPKKKPNIPTDEELQRASDFLAQRSRGLSDLRDLIRLNFKNKIHESFIFYCSETHFKACIFYNNDFYIKKGRESGFEEKIKNFIILELSRLRQISPEDIFIELELDSHESVLKKYHGNYDKRLR